jgi:hypothetical protein
VGRVIALTIRPVQTASETANKWITLVVTLGPLGLAFLKLPVIWAAWISVSVVLMLVFWAAVRLQGQVIHLTNLGARRREIRERLAALIVDGDQAWNAASIAYQVWKKAQGQSDLGPGPEWSKSVSGWLTDAEHFLAGAPEMGMSYADVFRAQEPTLLDKPKRGAPLSTENRTQEAMALVRLKQEKLKEFMKDFKD